MTIYAKQDNTKSSYKTE